MGRDLRRVTDIHSSKKCGSLEEYFSKYITLKNPNAESIPQVENRVLSPSMTFENPMPTDKH